MLQMIPILSSITHNSFFFINHIALFSMFFPVPWFHFYSCWNFNVIFMKNSSSVCEVLENCVWKCYLQFSFYNFKINVEFKDSFIKKGQDIVRDFPCLILIDSCIVRNFNVYLWKELNDAR